MEVLSCHKVLERLCAATGKWGLFVGIHTPYDHENPWGEVFKAIPFLTQDHLQIVGDGVGWLLFDTEEEQLNHYWLCVGDDGPTPNNPYDGPARVYALTCNPQGVLCNENT